MPKLLALFQPLHACVCYLAWLWHELGFGVAWISGCLLIGGNICLLRGTVPITVLTRISWILLLTVAAMGARGTRNLGPFIPSLPLRFCFVCLKNLFLTPLVTIFAKIRQEAKVCLDVYRSYEFTESSGIKVQVM